MTSGTTQLAIGLGLLVLVTVGTLTCYGVRLERDVLTAAVRAAVQLAFIALALRGVFTAPALVIAVVAVMFTVAVGTSARRNRALPDALRATAVACAAGATIALGLVFAVPVVHRDVRTLVALAGIVIGGCMTASTLTGRRLHQSLLNRRHEVEAWLALGATSRTAVRDLARSSVREALVPALDQTRTVGLVTLPGAFVGALFGGADPGQAARFQLTVLLALLCAEAVTSVSLAYQFGAPTTLPEAFLRAD